MNPKSSLLRFYGRLKPRGYGDLGVEEFPVFEQRVASLLPNFPSEVLKDWIYRHYVDVVHKFGWLDIRLLRFEQRSWSTDQIVSTVRASEEELIEGWQKVFEEGGRNGSNHRKSRLGQFMCENGTWPVPPLIMPDTSALVPPADFALKRCYLMEGHHRLAYLRAIENMPDVLVRPEHLIWAVRLANE